MVQSKIKKKKGKGKKGEPLAASKDKSRDMLSKSGLGAGVDFVDSASKFLASYGKIIMPVVVIIIAIFAYVAFAQASGDTANTEMRNKIDQAAIGVEELDELDSAMEPVIAEAEEEEIAVTYAYYRNAVRAYELLDRPYKVDQLKKVVGIMGDFIDQFGETEDEEQGTGALVQRIEGLHASLKSDLEFLQSDKNKQLMPWSHNSEASRPEPVLTDDTKNPVVVFVTSAGKFEVELFENDAGNAVKHFVSLCGETNSEGDTFYDRTEFSAASFSNHFSPTGPYKNSTIITAGAKGRPVGVELEKPTTAKEGEDVDTVTEENPYTIDYQGSPTARFEVGSIALVRDTDNPMRARTEFMVVLEPSDILGINFAPLGKITDEKGLDVARRLHNAEIYYSYVKQKRKDTDYTPRVYYDGWPVATLKKAEPPEPVRFSSVETEILPADSTQNPIVVFELEAGDIVIELYEGVCPNTVANFINLIEEGFYDQECEFYRVEGSATDLAEIYEAGGLRIIQGGFDQSQSRDGYDYGIKNEAVDNEKYEAAGLRNARGTIAMARTSDLNSASTEFFINLKDEPNWDNPDSPYCVFGEVLYGLDLVAQVKADDAIKSAKVLRKRDHKYVPEVKYAGEMSYVEKKPVDIPEAEEDEAGEGDE